MLTTTATTAVVPHNTDGVDDDDGYYSTAPSSPAAFLSPPPPPNFFYSAPTSPMHYVLSSSAAASSRSSFSPPSSAAAAADEFEFSSRVGSPAAVTSADELFLNGQIRPMKLSAHLSRPPHHHHHDDDHDDDDDRRDMRLRNRSQRRRARSMSPLRSTTPFDFTPEMMRTTSDDAENTAEKSEMTSAESASSSRCSSAGRSSKRWLFLKDFLRSKSEGRSNNKFWQNINIAFAPTTKEKEKEKEKKTVTRKAGVRRSAHEAHYAANRAKAEERRKKTYLPYRQGVLGCLGFNARSYGALHGFATALNPLSSR